MAEEPPMNLSRKLIVKALTLYDELQGLEMKP